MPGRKVRPSEHRITGSVYIDRPMSTSRGTRTNRLAAARKSEAARIDAWRKKR